MAGGDSFVVNSSTRHCQRCRKKIQDAVRAVDTGGVGAAVDASAGGGSDTDAVHDLARATSDVLGLQLLQRNMSLQRALKQSRKELDRHVCVYMTCGAGILTTRVSRLSVGSTRHPEGTLALKTSHETRYQTHPSGPRL